MKALIIITLLAIMTACTTNVVSPQQAKQDARSR